MSTCDPFFFFFNSPLSIRTLLAKVGKVVYDLLANIKQHSLNQSENFKRRVQDRTGND